jgi:hypothetical protein
VFEYLGVRYSALPRRTPVSSCRRNEVQGFHRIFYPRSLAVCVYPTEKHASWAGFGARVRFDIFRDNAGAVTRSAVARLRILSPTPFKIVRTPDSWGFSTAFIYAESLNFSMR